MAWYDNKASPGHGRMFFDAKDREHTVLGYAKTHNYMATSEQVYGYGKGIGRIEPYEGHGIRGESILMPWYQLAANDRPLKDDGIRMPWPSANDWSLNDGGILMPWCQSSTNDRPPKDDGYFSNVHDHVSPRQNYRGAPKNRDARDPSRHTAYDQSKDLPQNRDGSNPNRLTIYDQRKGLPWNRDGSDSNQLTAYDHNKGSPQNRDAKHPSLFAVYDQSTGSPRSKDANDQSRFVDYGQIKGSPWSKDAYKSSQFVSSPRKDPYEYGRNDELSDDEDDVICENGVCYKKGRSKPINHLKQEDYDSEKHKRHGYSPKKNPYYETPYDTNEKHSGNSHVPSYTVPITIPPRNGLYDDPSTNKNRYVANGPEPIKTRLDPDFPYENMRNSPISVAVRQPRYNGPQVNNLKPIKTRPGPDFSNENTRNSPVSVAKQQPQYNTSPRKYHGYEQSISNKASPPAEAYIGDKYKGISIDAKAAAKKYDGVLFTD